MRGHPYVHLANEEIGLWLHSLIAGCDNMSILHIDALCPGNAQIDFSYRAHDEFISFCHWSGPGTVIIVMYSKMLARTEWRLMNMMMMFTMVSATCAVIYGLSKTTVMWIASLELIYACSWCSHSNISIAF